MEDLSQKALAFFAQAHDGHDDHVVRARHLLERAIRQRWADGMLARDHEPTYGGVLGPAEIERLMRPPGRAIEPVEDHRFAPQSPVGEVGAALGLMPTEADLLAVLLAYETDPASSRLAAYLAGHPQSPALTIDTLFEIVYKPRPVSLGEAAQLLHADLAPEGPARRLRFLIVDGTETRPFLAQHIRLHPRFTAWLLGRRGLDAELSAHARLVPPIEPAGEHDPAQVDLAARVFERGERLLVLRGAAGSGRELLLRAVAHRLGRPLLIVSGRGLDADRVVAAFREATLHGAILALRDADDVLTGEACKRLRECVEAYRGAVALLGVDAGAPQAASLRTLAELELAVPPHGERLRLWQTHLTGAHTLTEAHWKSVAGLYNLGIGGIVAACALARELADAELAPVSRGHVARAVRQLFDSDLSAIARRTDITQTWDDVVLPEEVVESLVGLVDRIAFRNEVLGEWGFGRKVGKGLGLTALFSGQPGTGKSMVAGLIARELGLDLYVIDLSRVVSKWLGETEKNLARAFDAAEAGHVLLLFDEADSVLGKRATDVRNANDRHANLETNFILARLEQFHGIAVFTTNIPSAVDPAIMRRMSAHIAFPFPDVEARAELWRRMIPAEAPVQGKIDFVKLAREYELSGGYIRNVVLRAAYLAAREGQPIAMRHLERAARGEYGDRGALTVGGRLT